MDDHATPHTYEQAAAALGIQAEAVRARLRRGALRRGPLTNDRRPTVLLSPADIATIRAGIRPDRPESTSESGPDSAPESAGRPDERDRTINALEAAAAALHERAARAEAERDMAKAAASAERTRAEQAEAEREAARIAAARAEGEAVALRGQVQAERERTQAAEAARDGARAELADWTAGGPLGRAWRALVYRRGRS
jgi:hypothetical protein